MENLNINYDKTVSNATVSMISAGAILVISVLIVLLVLVIKRWKGRFIPLALGVLSYVVFGFMFSQLLMSVLSLIPNVDQSFTYNTNAYVVIYNILLAAGFGIARWFTAKMMTDRYNRTGDVLMAGTGLAIGDTVITYALSMFTFFVYAQAISAYGLEKFISDMFNSIILSAISRTADTAIKNHKIAGESISCDTFEVYNVITSLSAIPLLNISEMNFSNPLADIALNIMLFMVVYGVVKKQVNYMYAYYAIIAQFVSNIMFQLYNAFSLTNIIVLFIVKLVIVGGIALFIKQFIMKEIKYSND